jgi:tetratricopeptide (TPR) repeat protein
MKKTIGDRLLLGSLFSLLFIMPAGAQQITQAAANMERSFVEACRERLVGNYDKAIPLLQDLLKKDNKNHAALYELARIFDIQSKYEQAESLMNQAMALDPANDWYKKFMADIYQKSGKFTKAASLYEWLARKEPNNEGYYFKWAYFLVKADEIDQAIKVYDELEKRVGVNEEAVRRKHSLYIGKGNNKKAAEELQRLINAFPQKLEYRHLLAGFYEQIGDKSKAEAEYRQILKIAPKDTKAGLALAGGRGASSDDQGYLQALRPVFDNAGADIDMKMSRLIPFIQKIAATGDSALANEILLLTDILEKIHPGNAKPLAAAGDVYFFSGRRKQALEKYTEALRYNKSVYAVWEQLMQIHYDAADYAGLSQVAEQALDYFPNKASAQLFKAAAMIDNKALTDAADILDQAALMVGTDAYAAAFLAGIQGTLLQEQKKIAEAEALFVKAAALYPAAPDLLCRYSRFLLRGAAGLDTALPMARKAADLLPENALYQYVLGMILFKQKKYAEALNPLGKALSLNEERSADFLETYGDASFLSGQPEDALQYWMKAKAKGASSAVLEKKIREKNWYE